MQIVGLDPASSFTRNIGFQQSYFNGDFLFNTNQSTYSAEPLQYAMLRSRLDVVNIDDQTYCFTYNKGMGLPDKSTKIVDHFGFYNGLNDLDFIPRIESGTWLNGLNLDPIVPKCTELNNQIQYKFYYQRPRRHFNLDYAIAGSLNKIVYPTGGYTTFEYEPHTYFAEGAPVPNTPPQNVPYTPEAIDGNGGSGNVFGGGLRIKEIKTYDTLGAVPLKKTYTYLKEFSTSSSGKLINPLAFFYFRDDLATGCVPNPTNGNFPSYFFLDSSGILGQNMAEGKEVGYDRVTETVHGPGFENYINVHVFENFRTEYIGAFNTIESRSIVNGKPVTKSYKNSSGATVQQESYALIENQDDHVYGLSYNGVEAGFGLYYQFLYKMPIGSAEIEQKTTTTYFDTQNLETVSQFSYNSLNQMNQQETENSKDETIRTEYKRIAEFANANCVNASNGTTCLKQYMLDENIVDTVLEEINFLGNEVISATGYRYDLEEGNLVLKEIFQYDRQVGSFVGSVNGFEFPSYRSVVTYDKYDSEGNVLQYTVANGATTALVWNHNPSYPIVKGDNIGYDDLLQAHTNALSNGVETATYEMDIRSDALVQNALISTYDYDPLKGLVKMNDHSGRKTSYAYDEFSRLKHVKDIDDKLLSDYTYNYVAPPQFGGISVASALHFGVVEPGTSLQKELNIENNGNYDVTINSLSLPPNFSSSFQNTSFLVKVGESFNLPVSYNSPSTAQGYVTGELILQSSNNLDGNVSTTVSATGEIEQREFEILPPVNQSVLCYEITTGFGTAYIGVRNDGNSALTIISASCDGTDIDVSSMTNGMIPPNSTRYFGVQLQLPITASVGEIWDQNAIISIQTDANVGPGGGTVSVNYNCNY